MIYFSPAKINLGLHILNKRNDGYHDISTLMYVLPYYDIIEINVSDNSKEFGYSCSGISIPGEKDSNLCRKAWELFNADKNLPPVKLHLHKKIPVGAGLGGGSSNGATTLLGLNQLSDIPMAEKDLLSIAASLGSDCPVFIKKQHAIVSGRGEFIAPFNIDLSDHYLVLCNPGVQISTAEAYSSCRPNSDRTGLKILLRQPLKSWKDVLVNDFEESIFPSHPEIRDLKSTLYKMGAVFALMSGSGSSVYGIFKEEPATAAVTESLIWSGWL